MQIYRKKQANVKAFQWFPEMGETGGVVKSKTFSETAFPQNAKIRAFLQSDNVFVIPTNNGPHAVYPGDWVVTEPGGVLRVYSPEAFQDTFEAVAL